MIQYQIVYFIPDPFLGGQVPFLVVAYDRNEVKAFHVNKWYEGLSRMDGILLKMVYDCLGKVDLATISPQITVSEMRTVPPDAKAYEWLSRLASGFWS